ncbi:MAG TPA: hypothetical protein VJ838_04555 [Gaiellaceae bacterium]|nr:hypothetical protein [Gaiellaceae bacterium]
MFGLLAALLVVTPPHFGVAPGWHIGSTRAHACVGVSRSRCVTAEAWASTVRYRDCPNCSPPHKTLAALPPGGIIIQLSKGRERPAYGPRRSWPPRLRASQVVGPFEGAPRRIGVIQVTARTRDDVEYFVFAWFGRAHPTRRQMARANAELGTAR